MNQIFVNIGKADFIKVDLTIKNQKSLKLLFLIIFLVSIKLSAQNAMLKIALVKYKGGGDWYANPTALPNLIRFCNKNLNTKIQVPDVTIDVGSREIFEYPFVHLTGHGNVIFSENEAENLRNYLIAGGFMHIDDNYGLDPYIRREMKKVFPELNFIELPFSHPIYHQKYNFPAGLPKIHEHDRKPSQGFGLIYEDRLICFYTFESDLGDGWEDIEVHNDSPEKHNEALKMGANIISYCFSR